MRRVTRVSLIMLLGFMLVAGPAWAGGAQEGAGAGAGGTSSGGTAAASTKYKEAPMLAEMVKAGKLPSVDERLPEQPLVVDVVDSIGTYGGTWRRWNDHPRIFAWEPLVKVDIDGSMYPNLAASWEISPDYRTFTFNLRKGIKWSDGVDYTTEDVMFYWEDLALNEEYTQVSPGGNGMSITAPDAYTLVITFPDPQPTFMALQSTQWGGHGFTFASYPKHYLKQFHPAYQTKEKLDAMIKEASMDTWQQLMDARYWVEDNPEIPVLTPWRVTTDPSDATQRSERNPYYWKVDKEGNQLPYIDYATWPATPEKELGILKLANGEIDMTEEGFSAQDTPTLYEYANQGNYTVYKQRFDYAPTLSCLHINQNYQREEEMADLLRNLKFRQALSVAIKRDEINEFIALGQGTPAQATVPSSHPAGSEELTNYMIQYDPAMANRLLDEIGLNKRDGEGFRLLPSGEKLTFVLSPRTDTHVSAAEIMKQHFEAVGVRTSVSVEDQTFWFQNKNNGLHMVSQYSLGNGTPEFNSTWWIPINANCYWAPMNGAWVASGGTSGDEPEGVIKEIIERYQNFLIETDEAKRASELKWIVETITKNLYMIGTVTRPPVPIPVSNKLKNVPKDMVNYSTRMTVWEYCQISFK